MSQGLCRIRAFAHAFAAVAAALAGLGFAVVPAYLADPLLAAAAGGAWAKAGTEMAAASAAARMVLIIGPP